MKKEKKPRKKLPEERFKPEGVIPLKESMETEPQNNKFQQQCIEAL